MDYEMAEISFPVSNSGKRISFIAYLPDNMAQPSKNDKPLRRLWKGIVSWGWAKTMANQFSDFKESRIQWRMQTVKNKCDECQSEGHKNCWEDLWLKELEGSRGLTEKMAFKLEPEK